VPVSAESIVEFTGLGRSVIGLGKATPPGVASREEARLPYAETPDGPLYYEHVNFQPPWKRATPVLLHHGIALTSDFWYDWLPVVAAEFPVIRFDWRGYGRSHVPGRGTAGRWSSSGATRSPCWRPPATSAAISWASRWGARRACTWPATRRSG